MKNALFPILIGIIISNSSIAQDSIVDPLTKFKRIQELGFSLVASQVIAESNLDEEAAIYKIDRRVFYVPDFDVHFNTGWIKASGGGILMEKIGIWILSRSVNLPGPANEDILYNAGFLTIPAQIGFRAPLNHSTYKDGMYRAIEIMAGVQASTPLVESLYGNHEFDPTLYGIVGKYIKFGVNAEITFTSLNKHGFGHRYGVRVMTDIGSFFKTGDTYYEIYPVFSSVGLFYNIQNSYR